MKVGQQKQLINEWRKADEGFFKVNCDGAWDVGWCRNENGIMLAGPVNLSMPDHVLRLKLLMCKRVLDTKLRLRNIIIVGTVN